MDKKEKIIISIVIANFPQLKDEILSQYLRGKYPEIEIFESIQIPGEITNAIKSWKIVEKISTVLGIVSFLWMAYDDLIKPNSVDNPKAGIIINIDNINISNPVWIGNQIKSEKDLKNCIIELLEKNQINLDKTEKILDSLNKSNFWKKVK